MAKKILKIVAIVLVSIIALGIVWFAWASQANKKKLSSNEKVYEATDSNAKNALLVYQKSRTSYASDVAASIANGLVAEGYQVTVNYPGDFVGTDLSAYDLVVFGTPIYMSQISSNLSDYINSVENWGQAKVVYYRTGMLESTPDEDKAINELFEGKPLAGTTKIIQSEYKADKNVATNAINSVLA